MTPRPSLLSRVDHTGVPLLIARLGVGGMFAYLAFMKLSNPHNFLKDVWLYNFLPLHPPQILNFLSLMLPYFELVCALALIAGVLIRGASAAILGMLVLFFPLLILRAMAEWDANPAVASFCALRFDCGCGTGETYICKKLAENVLLGLGALICLVSRSRRFCLEGIVFGDGRPARPSVHAATPAA